MEYLLANRFFMPITKLLFSLFFLFIFVTPERKLRDNIREVLEGFGWDIVIILPPGS